MQHRTAGRTNEVLSSVSPLPSSARLLGELRRQVRVFTNWSVGKMKIMLSFEISLSVCRSHLQTASKVKPAVSNVLSQAGRVKKGTRDPLVYIFVLS